MSAKFTMCETMEDLKNLLSQTGAAMMGGHVVVVAIISQEAACLRDPYHGWEEV